MRNLLGRLRRSGSRSLVEQLATLTSVGDGSTLTLDFTTGVLDQRLTFTRSSTATYINSSGYVTSIGAAPTNDPTKARFDHDPTTLAPRGLLIEGQAVNLLSYSENFAENTAGNWTGQAEINTTGTPAWTGFTAPDQQTTAHKIIPNTNNAQHYLEHAATSISSGTTYTVSLFVKPDGYNFVGLALTGGQARATYQLVAPYTRTTYVGSEVATITPYQNGWFRITLRWTASTTSSALRIYVQNAQQDPVTTFAGNNTGGIQAWGAQLEAGVGASSYIPTGASTGTRLQDQMQMTDLASLGFNTAAGTLTINGTYNKDANSAAYPRSIRFMGTSVQSMAMITSGKTLFGNTPNISGGSYFEASRTLASAGAFKFGWALTTAANPALASATVSLNGSSTSITPLGQGAIVSPTSLQFLYGAAAATDYPSMNISSVKYWPYAATAAELNVRTSL